MTNFRRLVSATFVALIPVFAACSGESDAAAPEPEGADGVVAAAPEEKPAAPAEVAPVDAGKGADLSGLWRFCGRRDVYWSEGGNLLRVVHTNDAISAYKVESNGNNGKLFLKGAYVREMRTWTFDLYSEWWDYDAGRSEAGYHDRNTDAGYHDRHTDAGLVVFSPALDRLSGIYLRGFALTGGREDGAFRCPN